MLLPLGCAGCTCLRAKRRTRWVAPLEIPACTRTAHSHVPALGSLLLTQTTWQELMEPLLCPPALRTALQQVWCAPGDGPYALLRDLIEMDDEESVLYHTIYRFLCLFGRPDKVEGGDEGGVEGGVCAGAAWAAIRSWLETSSGRARYAKDAAVWSAFDGRNKHLVEAQRRMRRSSQVKSLNLFRAACHSTPLRSSPLLSAPLHSTPLHSTPLHSAPLHSAPLHSTPLHSTPLDAGASRMSDGAEPSARPRWHSFSQELVHQPRGPLGARGDVGCIGDG